MNPADITRFRGRGFTLLELLVATSIFATLLGALYAVLFGGMRLRETAWGDFESGVTREQIAMTLRRDLTDLVVPAGILAGPIIGETESVSDLHLDKLQFYSTDGAVTDREPWGDIQHIEYVLAEPLQAGKSGEYDFVRRVRRDLLATTVEEEETPQAQWRLFSGVTSFTAEYYDGQAWNSTWDSTLVDNENPQAIHIELTFAPDKDGRARPPLEILCEIAPQPRTRTGSSATGSGAPATPPASGPTSSPSGGNP